MLLIKTLLASLMCAMHERHNDRHRENNSVDLKYSEKQLWHSVRTMAVERKSVLAQLISTVCVFTSAVLAKPRVFSVCLPDWYPSKSVTKARGWESSQWYFQAYCRTNPGCKSRVANCTSVENGKRHDCRSEAANPRLQELTGAVDLHKGKILTVR